MFKNLPQHIVAFAQDNVKVYEAMRDYFNHYMAEVQGKNIGIYDATVSLSKKDEEMHKALLSEVKRLSGAEISADIPMSAWASNPAVVWATRTTLSMMIDAILPDTIIKSIGVYTDIKYGGFGETATYEVEPNSLFTVSKGADGQRTAFKQTQFRGAKTLVAENHDVTVSVPMYSVLAGQMSIAPFALKAIMSMDRAMTYDAYDALEAVVNAASFPAALKKTGYTRANLLTLAETVSAYNNGAKATIVGTASALANVLPDSASGFRINTPADGMGIHLIKDFYEFDILRLPQVATGVNYGLKLSDSKIFVMSTGADKIIKGFIEGDTLTNSNGFYDNADLSQNVTFNKRWKFDAVTNATMGVVTL